LWKAVIEFADLQFYEPYTVVLDTSRDIAWSRWGVGGTMNAV
jgi:acetyl-CoA synthetase